MFNSNGNKEAQIKVLPPGFEQYRLASGLAASESRSVPSHIEWGRKLITFSL